jgi:hypothetical protein
MKYAFLVLAHTDPKQLRRLIHALDDEHFDFFVHIDQKSAISEFQFDQYELKHSTLHVLENRYPLYWGDISIVEATLALYRMAHATGLYSRYITLSGLDYPIKSNQEIYAALSDLSVEHIAGCPLYRDIAFRIRGFYLWKYGSKITTFCLRVHKLGLIRHKEHIKIDKKECPVYVSSQWHALSHEFVSYLLKTLDDDPKLLHFFKYSYAPDELLIPTILFNSPFGERANSFIKPDSWDFETLFATLPTLHYLRRRHRNLVVLDESDFHDLLGSDKLFFRKAMSGKSDELICKINHHRNEG